MIFKGRVGRKSEKELGAASSGIVVSDCSGKPLVDGEEPRIAAFIWGGKVRPAPTLPFGRWKGAA